MSNKNTKAYSYLIRIISVLKSTRKKMKTHSIALIIFAIPPLIFNLIPVYSAAGASASEINGKVNAALQTLYQTAPGAETLSKDARAILVFPDILKAGLIIGGQIGDGALRKNGKTVAYYRSVAASYGLQAGVQSFGYVLFFMDDASLQYLEKSKGWEIGTGPSVVVLDEGFGKNMSSTTLQKGVYAFIFSQKGLMAGIGLQGSKITRITPD
jgi:lipid-binding SYLF domain-containing protein